MKAPTTALAVVALVVAVVVLAMSCGAEAPLGPHIIIVLEPEENVQVDDLDAALDGALEVIERRVDELDLSRARVERVGEDRADTGHAEDDRPGRLLAELRSNPPDHRVHHARVAVE